MLLALVLLTAAAMAETKMVSGLVTNVASGDTIYVDGVGYVRMAGVQSPYTETYYGWRAQEYTCSMLMGTMVFVDLVGGTDKNGSLLATVYPSGPDGKPKLNANFNNLLLQGGYATVYTGEAPPENYLAC